VRRVIVDSAHYCHAHLPVSRWQALHQFQLAAGMHNKHQHQ